jgi:hypothetical protein
MKRSLAITSLFLVGCNGTVPPKTDVKWYKGSSKDQAMVRTQDGPATVIPASSPAFDDMVGLTIQDMGCLYQQIILNCKEWKDPTPACTPVSKEVLRAAVSEAVD